MDIKLSQGEIFNIKNSAGETVLSVGSASTDTVQEKLVSGTNIKTVNGASILGSGNLDTGNVFEAGAGQNSAVLKGGSNSATGTNSVAEGQATYASAQNAHAEGRQTSATTTNAHAEGWITAAGGKASHAEGYNTETGGNATANTKTAGTEETNGAYAHAEGNATIAKGVCSHSEGARTFADGEASHAEGFASAARAPHSHAEGRATLVYGSYAHAEGFSTNAWGVASHAEGYGTQTQNAGEYAGGKYNKSSSSVSETSGRTTHSVGIGTFDTDRKNAFEIMENGDAYLYGVGGYDGTNATASTSQTLQSLINKIDAFTSHGVSSIVALTESEYAALTTKDANTLYIVKPNPLLTGTGTKADPIVGWHENVAVVINPTGALNGTFSATIEGVYDFLDNLLTDGTGGLYFEYNGAVYRADFIDADYPSYIYIGSGNVDYSDGAMCFMNANHSNLGNIKIYSNDIVEFNLANDD